MSPSSKIKRLMLVAIAIVILFWASEESFKSTPLKLPTKKATPYPTVPADISPNIIDVSLTQKVDEVIPIAKPAISAEAYLVKDLDTGEVYAEHNPNSVFPIASLSKLVTAIVATHAMTINQKLEITQAMLDAGYGEAGHLIAGQKLSVLELLYPLLLESSNDAAEVYAQSFGYSAFIKEMNAFATKLGMLDTSFRDPSGISSGNISNPRDLYILAKYLYDTEKPLLEITRQTSITVASTTDNDMYVFTSINPFPLDPHFIGGKTGRTIEAKESMISLFQYTYGPKTYHIAVIVLRSDMANRQIDSSILLSRFIAKIKAK